MNKQYLEKLGTSAQGRETQKSVTATQSSSQRCDRFPALFSQQEIDGVEAGRGTGILADLLSVSCRVPVLGRMLKFRFFRRKQSGKTTL